MSDSDSDSDDGVDDGLCAIIPIQQQDVHRIVAGQVILDMASAVKELVDNALDAGASSINIRLFNQGVDVIEVSDDGTGVPKHSRPLLAMKHATSKIMSFDDLYKDVIIDGNMQPNQLGFRGEALFSLGHISQNLIVCTRTESETMAQKIQFNRDGYMIPNSIQEVARKVGTTVAVVKLFEALPVRRANLMNRLKAQRAKMFRLLQAYGVLCFHVRFNVIDINGPLGSKDCKNVNILSTNTKNKSIKETISAVLGSKFLSGLCTLRVDLSSIVEKALGNNANLMSVKNLWRIEGLVSNAPNGCHGDKVAREIHFFSINGRPVELPILTKIVSEVWRNFEAGGEGSRKRPACILGLYLPNSMFDINVAPDKREVFFTEEKGICELLRDELNKVWSSQTQGNFAENLVENMSNEKKRPRQEDVNNSHDDDDHNKRNKRMQRRNAFVNSFDNVGSATTDEHIGSAKDTYRREESPTTSVGCTSQLNSMKNHPLGTIPKGDKEASSSSSNDNLLNKNGLGVETESSSSSSRNQKKDPKNNNGSIKNPYCKSKYSVQIDDDRRLWNQKKIEFNAANSNSQLEEINKLNDMTRNDGKANILSTSNKNEAELASSKNLPEEASFDTVNSNSQLELSNKLKHMTRNNRNANNIHSTSESETELLTSAETISEEASLSGRNKVRSKRNRTPSISDKKRNSPTNRPKLNSFSLASKVTPTTPIFEKGPEKNMSQEESDEEEGVRLKIRRKHLNKKTIEMKERHTNASSDDSLQSDDDDAMSTNSEQDSNAVQTNNHLEEEDDDNKSKIIWSGFSSTEAVLEKAEAAHAAVMHRRKMLKELKCFRSKKNGNDADKDGHNKKGGLTTKGNGKTVSLLKEDFLTMKVIGQFNCGFIIAMCPLGQLWIFDQHACDERHNFEKLYKETKIHEQKLIESLPIELSPSEENCILENMEIFEQNGFRFKYDATKPSRQRFSLTSLPHSGSGGDGLKPVQFGKDDVGALCSILGADGGTSSEGYVAGSGTGADGSGVMGNNAVRRYAGSGGGAIIRLPKSIAMFASRACRSSIMIGEALSEKQMDELIKKLHEVDEPWTCAHGRPTIRHIKDLVDTMIDDEKIATRGIAGDLAALSQFPEDDNVDG